MQLKRKQHSEWYGVCSNHVKDHEGLKFAPKTYQIAVASRHDHSTTGHDDQLKSSWRHCTEDMSIITWSTHMCYMSARCAITLPWRRNALMHYRPIAFIPLTRRCTSFAHYSTIRGFFPISSRIARKRSPPTWPLFPIWGSWMHEKWRKKSTKQVCYFQMTNLCCAHLSIDDFERQNCRHLCLVQMCKKFQKRYIDLGAPLDWRNCDKFK